MSLETRLRKAAIEATGDDEIIDVAEFTPKGTAGATFAGAFAGSLAGGAATGGNSWGQGAGAAAGVAVGRAATGMSRDLPPYICIAATPTKVYALAMKSMYSTKLEPLAEIDRDRLGVEVHQRATVRTVVLEDLDTGVKLPLEVNRLNFYHGKAMVQLLMMSDEHHDDEPTEGELAAADAAE